MEDRTERKFIKRLKQNPITNSFFEIIGIVTEIREKEEKTVFQIDDSTGALECRVMNEILKLNKLDLKLGLKLKVLGKQNEGFLERFLEVVAIEVVIKSCQEFNHWLECSRHQQDDKIDSKKAFRKLYNLFKERLKSENFKSLIKDPKEQAQKLKSCSNFSLNEINLITRYSEEDMSKMINEGWLYKDLTKPKPYFLITSETVIKPMVFAALRSKRKITTNEDDLTFIKNFFKRSRKSERISDLRVSYIPIKLKFLD